jgi:hypothetical protein
MNPTEVYRERYGGTVGGPEYITWLEGKLRDHSIIASAFCRGVVRWEPFGGQQLKGELCVDGLRFSTELDDFSVPILNSHSERTLTQAVARKALSP